MVGKDFLVPTLAAVVLVLAFQETGVLHFLVWEIVLGRHQDRIFETKKKRSTMSPKNRWKPIKLGNLILKWVPDPILSCFCFVLMFIVFYQKREQRKQITNLLQHNAFIYVKSFDSTFCVSNSSLICFNLQINFSFKSHFLKCPPVLTVNKPYFKNIHK